MKNREALRRTHFHKNQSTQSLTELETYETIPAFLSDNVQDTARLAEVNVYEPAEKMETKKMESSLISAQSSVNGDILTQGHLEVFGVVKGNINCQGDLKVFGEVYGDIQATSIDLIHARVFGNLVAQEKVRCDDESLLIGDVQAREFYFNARMKGNVTVERLCSFEKKARIIGNVKAKLISAQEGSKIDGDVKISIEEIDDSDFDTGSKS